MIYVTFASKNQKRLNICFGTALMLQCKFINFYQKWPCTMLTLGKPFQLSNFLLGITEGDKVMLINHLFMIIKRYIYTTRCKEGVLNEAGLLHYICYHYELECNMIIHKKGNGHILPKKCIRKHFSSESANDLLACNYFNK